MVSCCDTSLQPDAARTYNGDQAAMTRLWGYKVKHTGRLIRRPVAVTLGSWGPSSDVDEVSVSPRVKRPRSFCQKCRWQVAPKHAYTLGPNEVGVG